MPKQSQTNLALLEQRQMDAVDAPCRHRTNLFTHRQRQLAEVVAVAHQHIEGRKTRPRDRAGLKAKSERPICHASLDHGPIAIRR